MGSSAAASYFELPIIAEIFSRLERELPQQYLFHSAEHSRDVLREAVFFAEKESRTSREVELLAIAAAYHDSGFLTQALENEPIGADIAGAAMSSDGGYSDSEIALVRQMICDTRLIRGESGLYQSANSDLSRYLLDADLSNFGREDFFEKLERLITERGGSRSDELEATLALMTNHQWCTEIARTLRDETKQSNIARLKAELEADQS